MLKYFISCSFFLFCIAQLFSQDLLCTSNGDTLKVNIIEKTGTVINYRLFEQEDKEIKFIRIEEVDWIKLESGYREFFNEKAKGDTIILAAGESYERSLHILTIDPVAIFWGIVKLNYEFIPHSRKIGIGIPFTMRPSYKIYAGGISCNYYFFKTNLGKYNIGSLTLGWAQIKIFAGISVFIEKRDISFFLIPRLKPGGVFQFRNGLFLGGSLEVGVEKLLKTTDPAAKSDFSIAINGMVGWRFQKKAKKLAVKGKIY